MASDDSVDTDAAFQRELVNIVNEAVTNGVDVEGAWPILNDDTDLPDWDLEITALASVED